MFFEELVALFLHEVELELYRAVRLRFSLNVLAAARDPAIHQGGLAGMLDRLRRATRGLLCVTHDASRQVGIPLQSAVRFRRENRKKLPGISFADPRADGAGFFRALRQEALITVS